MKMPTAIFAAAWPVAVAAVSIAAGLRPGVDDVTLFLATFDDGLEADYARDSGSPKRSGGVERVAGLSGGGLSVPPGALGVAYPRNGLSTRRGTVEFWFKAVTVTPGTQKPGRAFGLFSTETAIHNGMAAWIAWNRHLVFRTSESYRSLSRLEHRPRAYDDGRWHHFAFTWDRDALQYFLDGTRQAVTPAPTRFARHGGRGEILVGYRGDDERRRRMSPEFRASSAEGVFDDVRFSDCVRYIADFNPPEPGFAGTASSTVTVYPDQEASGERSREDLTFSLSFGRGFEPEVWRTGQRTQVQQGNVTIEGQKGSRSLHFGAATPPGAVAYRVGDAVSRFLGSVSLVIAPAKLPAKPVTVLELTDAPGTGPALTLRPDGGLSFGFREGSRTVSEATTAPLAWAQTPRRAVRMDWSTAVLRVWVDGAVRAESRDVVVPSRIGTMLRIGGRKGGGEGLAGRVDEIRMFRCPPMEAQEE